MFSIKIIKDGPYIIKNLNKLIVEAYLPTTEKTLSNIYQKELLIPNELRLCRCGKSKNKPYCDGQHITVGFQGDEVSSLSSYVERSEIYDGDGIQLLDDERCAFARFCHRKKSDVWTLTEESYDAENKKEAIKGASACPSGRLTIRQNNNLIEETYENTISIAQDPLKEVSASLNIRGNFTLESAEGKFYEKRNRMALCRCGQSKNKPFCDSSHVKTQFNDSI